MTHFQAADLSMNKTQSCLPCQMTGDLRNQSNNFSVDRGINQKRTENCINEHSALLQKFSVLFSIDTSINLKNIRFISYHLINNETDHSNSYKRRIIFNV